MFAQIVDGKVVNVIVADQAFVDSVQEHYVNIDDADPRPGIGWSFDGTTFIRNTPPEVIDPRLMKIAIISIESDDANELVNGNELTCSIGSTVSVAIEVRAISDDSVLPISEIFRLPISASNGTVIYTLVNIVNGYATISTTLTNSSKWTITESDINSMITERSKQFVMKDDVILFIIQ